MSDWRDQAVCKEADPNLFYSNKPAEIKQAVEICNTCPVRVLCANYAVAENEEYGVWGGLTEADRRQLRKKRSSRAGVGNRLK